MEVFMVEKSLAGSFWPSLVDPFRQIGARISDWLSPASEASGGSDAYRVTLELPGVQERDIHVSIEGGTLSVKGEKRTERTEKGDTWFFSERQFGSFARSFRLPADADEDEVNATLKDGVLTLVIARKPAGRSEPAGRRIPIET
jgi:HSP20 family protein